MPTPASNVAGEEGAPPLGCSGKGGRQAPFDDVKEGKISSATQEGKGGKKGEKRHAKEL